MITNDSADIRIEENLPKTFNLKLNKKKHKDLIEVLICLSLVNKNLYNTTLFIVKNVYSSYVFDKQTNAYDLKPDKLLHDNQKNILLFINSEIINFNKLNLERYNKKKAKLESNNSNKNLKEYVEYKDFTNCINQGIYNQLLNSTFLQYLVELFSKKQSKEQNLEFSDYELLPGRIRQTCIQEVIDNYITYYKSIKAFSSSIKSNNNNYNGYPKPPKYMSKNMGKTYEFPGADLGESNKLVKLKNINHLYKDYDKKVKLSDQEIRLYKAFSYKDLLDKLKEDFSIDDNEKPLLLRFTPKSNKTLKIQTVFNTKISIKPNTILGKTITAIKNTENSKKYTNLLNIKNTSIVKALKTIPEKELLNINSSVNISGIDLGITNILSTSYYSDKTTRGQIYSAKDYTKNINTFNRKLDNIQKKLANKTVLTILDKQSKLKEKEKENDKLVIDKQSTDTSNKTVSSQTIDEKSKPTKEKSSLTKAEISLLHQYQKLIYEDIGYRKVLDRKNNFINDYIHKLTTCVVENLIKNKVQLVVVGKNIAWKTNTDMGKKMNRSFYSIAHAQIINTLRYKCYENNILLVTTEESYTSKTSFMNNVRLKEFDKTNNTYVEQSEFININSKVESIKNIQLNKTKDTIKAPKLKTIKVDKTTIVNNFGGLRDPIKRNRFKNKTTNKDSNAKATYTFIHSDLNAAYNIIRKIVSIEYDKKILL